jgi:hypothetical protein
MLTEHIQHLKTEKFRDAAAK